MDEANKGLLKVFLNFPAVNLTSAEHYPTVLASNGMGRIIEDEVKNKFGFYVADFQYEPWSMPSAFLALCTNDSQKASNALQHALEVMQSPKTRQRIADQHHDLMEHIVTSAEVSQPTIEQMAKRLTDLYAMEAELLSEDQYAERFRTTTPDQVAKIVDGFAHGPMFLNLKGHKDALNTLPSVEVINSWRSAVPSRRDPGHPRYDESAKP